MGTYYPSYYWEQPNTYPVPPQTKNKALPWVIIFSLILISFYTIYLYIQPDFVLESAGCSENFISLNLVTVKAGRFFLGDFKVNIAGIEYDKKYSDSVTDGQRVSLAFEVSLAPGTYSGEAYFRNDLLGQFNCKVR